MNISIARKQKKLISLTADCCDLSRELFKTTHIDGFSYARLDAKLGLIYLATHDKWLEHYFRKNFHSSSTFDLTPTFLKNKYTLWSTVPDNPVVSDIRENFNLMQGISVIDKQESYIDVFNFGSYDTDSMVSNWFINNLQILDQFSLYFKDKGEPFLKKIDNHAIYPVDRCDDLIAKIFSYKKNINNSEFDFLDLCKVKKIRVIHQNNHYILTKREYQCASYLIRGFSAKEIGIFLNLSQRTVELYIGLVKRKFECRFKSDLIRMLIDSDFSRYIGHNT